MTIAAGPFAIAAGLLAVGGAFKLVRPTDTANALRGVGLPGSPIMVRVGGFVESVLGGAALIIGNRTTAVLVAASYGAFLAFVVAALRRHVPIASCGCFGKLDTPPSRLHVGINAAALAAALAVAANPGVGLIDGLPGQPLAGAPYVLLVVIGVGLALLALSRLPTTLGLARSVRGQV